MWSYSQSSGELAHDGEAVGSAYSGRGAGLNNPALQNVSMEGPIPQGRYEIGGAFHHPVAGPVCMRLTPLAETLTYGRAGFMLHGDNSEMDHTASEGCIIAALAIREQVADAVVAGDDVLTVTA